MSTSKDASAEQITRAINAVMSGNASRDPDSTEAVARRGHSKNGRYHGALSHLETQVLALIQAGAGTQEIAIHLSTTSESVADAMHSIIEVLLKKRVPDEVDHGESSSSNDWLTGFDENLAKKKIFIGKYLIENLIGSGSRGAVFKAKHLYMNRHVALKLLRPELCSDRLTMRHFKREAMAIASLQHKNIVTVHDFGISKEQVPYLIMELANGTNLATIMENEPQLPARRIIDICVQVCAGLAHAHARGIIHCDLKPSNILMLASTPEETIKIVDFGLAQVLPSKITTEQRSTDQFFVNGTPLYMSPEQCIGAHVDVRSDIYSLGCILFEALTGVNIFEGATPMESLVKQCHVVAPPMSSIYSGLISPKLEFCVSKMLAKDPAERPQSMEEVTSLLLAVGE